MAEIDPYAVLGVSRTATRGEVARAYRSLVKRSHPDTGATTSPVQMARINEAWRLLSDPVRRARWDRDHSPTASPPQWSAPVVRVPRAASPRAESAPPSRMDSGWLAAGVVATAGVLLAAVMIGVSAIADPPETTTQFRSDEIRFSYPDAWHMATGDGTDPPGHRVVAHLLSFSVAPAEHCASLSDSCRWTGSGLPAGGASVLVAAWEEGEPPVPEPLRRRPFGLDADAVIGGEPAAFELRAADTDSVTAWWQLSPPGFPDRWIEIRADLRGGELEQTRLMGHVEALLDSIQFGD